jgi:antibiotic biosynthesis monooxygenase (ABM) superfamily enzyme
VEVAGCSSSGKAPEETPNVFPSAYKEEILNTLTTLLDDPTNVRGAYISDPVLRTVGKDQRYTVCVRFDSRDANKQYMGSKDRIGFFYSGQLNQLVDASKEQCGNAAYKPFPELEKLCQARKCL